MAEHDERPGGVSGGADGAAPESAPGAVATRRPIDTLEHPELLKPADHAKLNDVERGLLGDLFAIIEEHGGVVPIDRERVAERKLH